MAKLLKTTKFKFILELLGNESLTLPLRSEMYKISHLFSASYFKLNVLCLVGRTSGLGF